MYGHARGDSLLVQTAEALRGVTPDEVSLARHSGGCFVVHARGEAAGDLRSLLPCWHEIAPDGQSLSVGLARWHGREDVHELVARAQRALLHAESYGGDRVVVDDPARDREALAPGSGIPFAGFGSAASVTGPSSPVSLTQRPTGDRTDAETLGDETSHADS